MKIYSWKVGMTVALVVCFAALCFLCSGYDTAAEIEAAGTMMNPTATVEVRDDGVVWIGGEGKLYRDDVVQLLRANKLETGDVTDVVIGDDVTELGFSLFNGYSSLQTVYIGAGVSVINRGALLDCASLRFVFMPKNVRRVGKSFMFGSDSALVVADCALGELPNLPGVSSMRVLADVHSYEELVQRCSEMDAPSGDDSGAQDADANAIAIPQAVMRWWD